MSNTEENNTTLKNYTFKVYLGGFGRTIQEAWEDAVYSLSFYPGSPPEDYEISEVYDENFELLTEDSLDE